MAQAKAGDTVSIHYTGKLDDETVFDSSRGAQPLTFTLGAGQVIPGFDRGVLGMAPGEEKTITIPADEAYGAHRDDLVGQVERSVFPADLKPEVGQQLQMQDPTGQTLVVTVKDVNDATVTLDANHPLAGENLTFELELVAIES